MDGTHKTITLLEIAKNASLGKSMHAPQARISKAVPEKYSVGISFQVLPT